MNDSTGLFERLTSWANLRRSAIRAFRGKAKRTDAARFMLDLEPQLLLLRRQLRDGSYHPGPYRTFESREPKLRTISVAPFRDRVVHHVLMAILDPLVEPRLIGDSYACRKGKGTHRALDRFTAFARRLPWVLHGDVSKFFPSIDHSLLKERLCQVVPRGRVLDLFPAERVAVLLHEPQSGHRRTLARSREGHELNEAITISRSLAQKVLVEKSALVVSDTHDDQQLPHPGSVLQKGLRSILIAPIAYQGQVLGLLWADTLKQRGAFGSQDLPVFTGLAASAASALAVLRLAERARAHNVALHRLGSYLPREVIRDVMTRRVQFPVAGEHRAVEGEPGGYDPED